LFGPYLGPAHQFSGDSETHRKKVVLTAIQGCKKYTAGGFLQGFRNTQKKGSFNSNSGM
jgi:hypothetical protein